MVGIARHYVVRLALESGYLSSRSQTSEIAAVGRRSAGLGDGQEFGGAELHVPDVGVGDWPPRGGPLAAVVERNPARVWSDPGKGGAGHLCARGCQVGPDRAVC